MNKYVNDPRGDEMIDRHLCVFCKDKLNPSSICFSIVMLQRCSGQLSAFKGTLSSSRMRWILESKLEKIRLMFSSLEIYIQNGVDRRKRCLNTRMGVKTVIQSPQESKVKGVKMHQYIYNEEKTFSRLEFMGNSTYTAVELIKAY